MSTITMTRGQYDALYALAQEASAADASVLQKQIDKANGITRYILWVLWQDVGGQPPPRIELKNGWPATNRQRLELERKIARSDVDDFLRVNAVNPVGVMVTPDPDCVVGITLIDDYDFNTGG